MKLKTVIITLGLPLGLLAQSNSMKLCDQQATTHCVTLKAPATLPLSPTAITLSGSSGGLLVGMASTDMSILPGAVVSADALISASAIANASVISMHANPATGGADISVGKTGSGTLLPLRFFRNPTEMARFDVNNRLLVGLSSSDVSSGLGSIVIGDALVSASATTNASVGSFAAIGGSYVALSSSKTGSGSYLPLSFFTSASERMRISAGGDVGIGTTAPAYSLHVYKSQDALTSIAVDNDNGGSSNGTGINFNYGSLGAIGSLTHAYHGSGSTFDLHVAVWDGATSVERLTILGGSGNVGLGTMTPTHTLEVDGTVGISGATTATTVTGTVLTASVQFASTNSALNTISIPNGGAVLGVLGINGLTNASQMRVSHTAVDGGLFFTSTAANNGLLSGGAGYDGTNWIAKSSTGAVLVQLGGTFGLGVYTNTGLTSGSAFTPTLRAVMNHSGHLLIGTGTDNSSGALLQVAGDISYTGVLIGAVPVCSTCLTTAGGQTIAGTDIFKGITVYKNQNGLTAITVDNDNGGASAGVGVNFNYGSLGTIGSLTHTYSGSGTSFDLHLKAWDGASSIERVTVLGADGSVGIGITIPTSSLHVYRYQNSVTALTIDNDNGGGSAGAGINFNYGTAGTIGSIAHTYHGTGASFDLHLNVWDGAASIERVSVLGDSGHVLVGATVDDSSTGILQVAGFVSAAAGYYSAGTASTTINVPLGGATLGVLGINGLTNASQVRVSHAAVDGGMFLTSTAANNGLLSGGAAYNGTNWIAKSSTGAVLLQLGGAFGLGIYTNTGLTSGSSFTPTLRAVLNHSGHLLIGTGTDDGSGSLFQVAGSASITGNYFTAGIFQTQTKGNLFGNASGSYSSPTSADANVLLYDLSGGNWSGIGADGSGNMWFRVGLSGTGPAQMILDSTGVTKFGSQVQVVTSSLSAPGLFVQNPVGTTTGDAFSVLNSAGSRVFGIIGSGDAGAPNTVATWDIAPIGTTGTRSLGNSTHRWSTVWGVIGDFSAGITSAGDFTFGPSSGSTAASFMLLEGSSNGTEYVALKAPDAIAASVTWTLPNADGTNGQVLQTDGSGGLSWTTSAASGMANPMTTTGDLIYASTTATPATPSRLGIGTVGQCLVVTSGLPAWGTCTGTSTAAGSDTQIQYNNAGSFGASGAFTWDDSVKLLTVAANTTGAQVLLSARNLSTGSGASSEIDIGNNAGGDALALWVNSSNFASANSYAYIFNRQNAPLILGANNAEGLRIGTAGDITAVGKYTTSVKGNKFGSNSGSSSSPTTSDANVILYDSGSNNWAGIGADASGNMWFRTGLSGTGPAQLTLDTAGVATFGGQAFVSTSSLANPGLLIQNPAGTTTGDAFRINNSSGTRVFGIIGSGDAGAPNTVATWDIAPIGTSGTRANGNSTHRWSKVWAVDIDFSGTLTGGSLPACSLCLTGQGTAAFNTVSAMSAVLSDYNNVGLQIRESGYLGAGGGTATSNAPRIGFHWAGVTAAQLGVDSVGVLTVWNNPGTGYTHLRASNVYAGGGADDSTGAVLQANGFVSATAGYYSASVSPNALNIPAGGMLALNGTFGSVANYLVLGGSAPQIDASGLGGVLTVRGSSTTNGNILLAAGNVSGSSSVVIQATRADQPGLRLESASGTTTGTILALRNNVGAAKVWFMQSGDATCPDCFFSVGHFPTATNMYDLGSLSARWRKVVGTDADFSGTITGNLVTSLAASSPVSVSAAIGSVLVSCSPCLTTAGSQTISGQDTFSSGVATSLITAASLGSGLALTSSTATNGNISLNPGAVAGAASVIITVPRLDQPGLVIQNYLAAGTSTGNVFEIRDSGFAVVLQVIASADAGAPNALTLKGQVSPIGTTPTYTVGNSTHRWLTFYGQDGNFSNSVVVNGTTRINSSGGYLGGTVDGTTLTASIQFTSTNSAGNTLSLPNGGATIGTLGVNGLSDASQVRVSHTATDGGLFLTSTADNNGLFSGGAAYNGSNWIAKSSTGAVLLQLGGSFGFGIYTNTSLTSGVSFTPTLRAVMNHSGHLLIGTGTDNSSGALMQVAGSISMTGSIIASGNTGITGTKTVRDSAGTGTCTLIFTGGILTGGTC